MKRCLTCDALFASSLRDCSKCGASPEIIDGFYAYAPTLAHAGGGFKSSYFSKLVRLEEGNFWFRSRNQLIAWTLRTYCRDFNSLLEIGCGTGYVLSFIADVFPNASLYGSEIFTAGLGFAATRSPLIDFMQMDARNIPFHENFDVVGAFDVLEHIEEDKRVLSQIHAALKPQGFMLLTVPQHAWLWSAVDEYACHVRRYDAKDLHEIIEGAGFQIVRSTSFVTTLLPAMMVSRFRQRKIMTKNFDVAAELKISPWLNSLFGKLLSLELAAIKSGMNSPVGGSRLVVAKKT